MYVSAVAVSLPTIDKHNIPRLQPVRFSFIDQFALPILYYKAKIRLQFLTPAGMGL